MISLDMPFRKVSFDHQRAIKAHTRLERERVLVGCLHRSIRASFQASRWGNMHHRNIGRRGCSSGHWEDRGRMLVGTG